MLASVMSHAKILSLFSAGVVPNLRETPPARDNAGDRGRWAVSTPMATPSPTEQASGIHANRKERLLDSPEKFPFAVSSERNEGRGSTHGTNNNKLRVCPNSPTVSTEHIPSYYRKDR